MGAASGVERYDELCLGLARAALCVSGLRGRIEGPAALVMMRQRLAALTAHKGTYRLAAGQSKFGLGGMVLEMQACLTLKCMNRRRCAALGLAAAEVLAEELAGKEDWIAHCLADAEDEQAAVLEHFGALVRDDEFGAAFRDGERGR